MRLCLSTLPISPPLTTKSGSTVQREIREYHTLPSKRILMRLPDSGQASPIPGRLSDHHTAQAKGCGWECLPSLPWCHTDLKVVCVCVWRLPAETTCNQPYGARTSTVLSTQLVLRPGCLSGYTAILLPQSPECWDHR